MICPLTYCASWLANHATALATSRGEPNVADGIRDKTCLRFASLNANHNSIAYERQQEAR
jgi:hypothetical protein